MSYAGAAFDTDTSAYIRRVMKAPLLSREYEQELALRWRDDRDEEALHELIMAYARLVVGMTKRFRRYGLAVSDLIQEGNVGLMQAAERFSPEKGVRFSTYASWWVRSAMQDFVLRNWSIVRTGTTSSQKSLFFNFRRLRARIERSSGRGLDEVGRDDIAESLGVSRRDVDMMENRLTGSDQSLNAPVGEDGDADLGDFIPDDRPNPEDVTFVHHAEQTRTRWIGEALATLPDREAMIIQRRHLGEDGETLEALGDELGVSKERVRQLEKRALGRLRAIIEKKVIDPRDLLVTD